MITQKPHRGVLILVFGILGLILGCPIFAIVAWVMGRGDLKEIDAGRMDREGRSLTQAGMVLGIVGVVLAVIGLLIGGGMLVLAMLAGTAAH